MEDFSIYDDVDFGIEGLEELPNAQSSDKTKSRTEDGEYLNFDDEDYNSEEAEIL